MLLQKLRSHVGLSSCVPRPSIPQMPEGHYSFGPNPNRRRVVEEHVSSYQLIACECVGCKREKRAILLIY